MLTPGFNRWGQRLLHFGTSPAALVLDGVVYRRKARNQHKLMFGDNACEKLPLRTEILKTRRRAAAVTQACLGMRYSGLPQPLSHQDNEKRPPGSYRRV